MPTSRRGGGVTKRCECRGDDGRRLGASCPHLSKRSHGNYEMHQELPPDAEGKRRRFRRTGFTGSKDAQAALDRVRAVLDLAGDDEDAQRRVGDLLQGVMRDRKTIPEPVEVSRRLGVGVALDGRTTLGDWLDTWLASKKTKKKTTGSYESHARVWLKPHLGHHRLDRLTVGHLQEFFDSIDDQNEVIAAENQARREQEARCRWGKPCRPPAHESERLARERAKLAEMPPYRRPTGPATKQRIRATLRVALNKAIGRQLLTFNPAVHVELDPGRRPKAMLWTPDRIARWRESGERPSSVMVWMPTELGEFLDAAESSEMYEIFHLIAFRGLRRGEAVGQEDADVNLTAQELTVSREVVVDGWTPREDTPKTEEGAATIGLDTATVAVLGAYRERRNARRAERIAAGLPWADTGKFFAAEDGSWYHPEAVSDEFRRIVEAEELPPVSLRDLRHVAAGLIHLGGGDIHVIKEVLRHSTIQLASETYTPLFREVDLAVAERAAALVPRARKADAVGAAG